MKRWALRVLLVSIGISAALGIIVILTGRVGDTAAKVLLTSTTISFMSLFALACFAAWDAPAGKWFSRVGVATSLGAGGLFIAGIWHGPTGDFFWKVALSLWWTAITCAQCSLLSLARLAPAHRWARQAANATAILFGAALLAVLWDAADGQTMFEIFAVLSILDGALTITTIVFHVLGRVAPPQGLVPEVLFCLNCGKRLWVPAGEVRCHHCEKRYFVELRPDGPLPDATIV